MCISKLNTVFFLIVIPAFLIGKKATAQLPTCPNDHLMYFAGTGIISNFDPNLPFTSTNPTLNSIPLLGDGLAVSPNLNATSPAVTFYTVVALYYRYYNGSTWAYTNHYAGTGANIGAGGGYIFNYDVSDGSIWRYNGSGNAILILNIGTEGVIADLAVDCSGNFYALTNSIPQSLKKYDSNGGLINTFSLVGAPVSNGGAGLTIFGNEVYYSDLNNFMHGTFNGNTVVFTVGTTSSLIYDLANCVGSSTSSPVFQTICENQLPFSWNGNSYSLPGTYTVTLTGSSGCDSVVTLNLSVGNSSTIVDTAVCPEQLPYRWNGNQYNNPGAYTGLFPGVSGCDSLVTVNLSIYPAPNASAGNDDTIRLNIPYHLSGSGGTSYEWSPVSSLNNSHIANPIAVITNSTTFYLLVKDNNNCTGRDTVKIKVVTRPSIFVPSAFSPGKDDINNIFRPIYTDIQSLDYFMIFNRYGQLVFKTTDLFSGWDGTYNGLPQNINGYVWVLQAIDNTGKIWKLQGNVVLIR
jgi:gliding motility-associated-like protein